MYQQQAGGPLPGGVQQPVWNIPQVTIAKYSQMFGGIDAARTGFVTGAQARGLLMQSGLPQDALAKIWALADGTTSGRLTIEEFILAMYLIEMTRAGHPIPPSLPPDLVPPSYRRRQSNTPMAGMVPPGGVRPGMPPPAAQVPMAPAAIPQSHPYVPPSPVVPPSPAVPTAAATPMAWSIPPPSQAKYGQLFQSMDLQKTGFVTGAQARGVLMQSGLPQDALAKIWALADATVSGRLMIEEFILAMHLIDMCKAGQPLPVTLPPDLVPPSYRRRESAASTVPPVPTAPASTQVAPTGQRSARGSISDGSGEPVPASMMLTEWAIPQSSKLKYNQLFNQHDRTRSGFLTGVQARGILVQSGLNQNILAKIWALCDVTLSGKLMCEEFVLAMHLIDMVKAGEPLPVTLPPELVPPVHRRRRNSSVSSVGSTGVVGGTGGDMEPTSPIRGSAASFEDKRKENFDKGQAVLDRKRQALLDQQRRELEERERKEREEQAKREKVRLEMERKRQEEIERQLQKQREIEAEKEEARKRMLEQREAARREMERQRMIEWESARMAELSVQKTKVMETIAAMKSKKKNLVIEGEKVTNDYTNAKTALAEARNKVANGKSVIDGMRVERDTKMKELNQLNSALKVLNEKENYVKAENERIIKELKAAANVTDENPGSDTSKLALQNKQVLINQLKEQIDEVEVEKETKAKDADKNAAQLTELKETLEEIKERVRELQKNYNNKVNQASELKEVLYQKSFDPASAWDEPVTNAEPEVVGSTTTTDLPPTSELEERQVLYQFEARNSDELDLIPGHTIWLINDPSAEEGWLKGRTADGKFGWFPEAYVGPPGSADVPEPSADQDQSQPAAFEPEPTPAMTTAVSSTSISSESSPAPPEGTGIKEQVVAAYSWLGKEASHLTVNKNEIITVTDKNGEWLFGEIGNRKGWFPASYSRSIDATAADDSMYVTLYPFEAQESGDLGFEANEVVQVIKKEGDWWTGTVQDGTNSRTGVFPSNYVREATDDEIPKPPEPTSATPKISKGLERRGSDRSRRSRSSSISSSEGGGKKKGKGKKPEVCIVIAPYKATGKEQLNLEKGQLIQVRKKNTTGWWEGETQQKGKKKEVGWFPATYVKSLSGGPAGATSGASSARSTPDTKATVPPSAAVAADDGSEKVISIYPFTAQHDDELSFDANEVIKILSKDDPTWWKGQIITSGAIGLFPSNHVQEYKYAIFNDEQNGHETTSFLSNLSDYKIKQRIRELISTEEDYQKDLDLVSLIFKDQLFSTRAISSSEREILFSNWDSLRDNNKRFLKSIKKSAKGLSGVSLGQSLSEGFKLLEPHYIYYCSRLGRAETLVDVKMKDNGYFADQLKRFSADPRLTGLSLLSYLLKPMQRVTKYPLLIKEIMKAANQDANLYTDLESALLGSEDLCAKVNEARRSFENQERLDWIQSHVILSDGLEITFNSDTNFIGKRELLHLGSLIKANSGKELMVFLFSDFLLLTIPSKDIGKVSNLFASEKAKSITYKMYKRPYFLDEIELLPQGALNTSNSGTSGSLKGVTSNSRSNSPSILRSSPSSVDTFDPTFFALNLKTSLGSSSTNSSKKVIPFKAISVNDKSFWIKNLTRAFSNYNDAMIKATTTGRVISTLPVNRRFSLISNVTGRLLVSIVEGINLQSNKSGQITSFVITSLGSPSVNQFDHLQVEQSDIVKSITNHSNHNNHDLMSMTTHSPLNFPPSPTEVSQVYCKNIKFGHSMRFLFSDDSDEHALVVSVYEKDPFSPDRLMGRAVIPLTNIRHELSIMSARPLTKHVTLSESSISQSRKGSSNVATSQQPSILLKLDIIPNN